MSKKTNKEEALRKRVYAFLNLHPEADKSFVVNHFRIEQVPKSTVYDILKRRENKIGAERQSGTGRPAVKMPTTKVNQLVKRINHKDGISQRRLATQYGVSQSYISQIINKKTSVRYRKKKKAPKRTAAQKAAIRPKCRALRQLFSKKVIILDDESYFGLSNSELSGNAGFYSSEPDETPYNVKTRETAKFQPKLLVWIALSEKGVSSHYIVPSRQAINGEVYVSKCLPRLVAFIKKVHNDDNIVFWPDLASAHYSHIAQEYLTAQKVDFVPREQNPACCPELRPIEDFWNELKRVVYDKGWVAKDLTQLRGRINYALKKLDQKRVHELGCSTYRRVDRARRGEMLAD